VGDQRVSTSQVFYDSSPHSEFSRYALHSTFDLDLKYVHLVTLTVWPQHGSTLQGPINSRFPEATSGDAEFTTLSVGGTAEGVRVGRGGWGSMPAGPGATNLNPFINDQGVFN